MVLNEAKPTPMIGIDRPLVDRVVQCIMVRHTPNQAGFDSTAEHRRLKQWVVHISSLAARSSILTTFISTGVKDKVP